VFRAYLGPSSGGKTVFQFYGSVHHISIN